MPSRRIEFYRRALRCLVPAALLAVTPKCLLCVLAYAGLGAALGVARPEICGASDGTWAGSWAHSLPLLGFVLAAGVFILLLHSRCHPAAGVFLKRLRPATDAK